MQKVLWKHKKFWCLLGAFILINAFSAFIDMKPAYNLAFLPLYPILLLMFGILSWNDIKNLKIKIFGKPVS